MNFQVFIEDQPIDIYVVNSKDKEQALPMAKRGLEDRFPEPVVFSLREVKLPGIVPIMFTNCTFDKASLLSLLDVQWID